MKLLEKMFSANNNLSELNLKVLIRFKQVLLSTKLSTSLQMFLAYNILSKFVELIVLSGGTMLLEITVGSSTVQPSTSSTSDFSNSFPSRKSNTNFLNEKYTQFIQNQKFGECGSIVKYTFLVKTDLKMHLKVIPIISTYKSSLILFFM